MAAKPAFCKAEDVSDASSFLTKTAITSPPSMKIPFAAAAFAALTSFTVPMNEVRDEYPVSSSTSISKGEIAPKVASSSDLEVTTVSISSIRLM